jgi:hypothetical protein
MNVAPYNTHVAHYGALHATAILDGTPQGAVRPGSDNAHRAFERSVDSQMRTSRRPVHLQSGAHGTPAELARWEDDGGATLPNEFFAREDSSG